MRCLTPVMRVLLFLYATALYAQTPAPRPTPEWFNEAQRIQQEKDKAPLGSLDERVARMWRSALQSPLDPSFAFARSNVCNYYRVQGYDLKAEDSAREALAATPVDALELRAQRMSTLAGELEQSGQLVKAAAIREAIVTLPQGARSGYYGALAGLYERMGELEKAEAAWKQSQVKRAAEQAQVPRAERLSSLTFAFGRYTPNELAEFYSRHGRLAEAEQIYKEQLDKASDSPGAVQPYASLLVRQGRLDDAIAVTREAIAKQEASPQPPVALLYSRQYLAQLLRQAGKPDEAIAVLKRQAETSPPANRVEALRQLAEALIASNRLEEAEKVTAAMSESADAPHVKHAAAFTLAQIRDRQNRHDEAQSLRASASASEPVAVARQRTVYEVLDAARRALGQGNVDAALPFFDEAVSLAAERVRIAPSEVGQLLNSARELQQHKQEAHARRIAADALRLLDQAPDHPRVAMALGESVAALSQLGMASEVLRAVERMERILSSAKGPDSPALNAVSYARIALLSQTSDAPAVLAERKRMLVRVEKATGPKSQDSLFALREVAWMYPSLDDWPEEQSTLARLKERTRSLYGTTDRNYVDLLEHIANRAAHNRQFEDALATLDQALEIVRSTPAFSGKHYLAQRHAEIERQRQALQAAPSHGNATSRWFDTDRPK